MEITAVSRANLFQNEIIKQNDWIDMGPQEGLWEIILDTVRNNFEDHDDELRKKIKVALSSLRFQGQSISWKF